MPGTQELYGLEFEGGFAFTDRWDMQLNASWNANEWTSFAISEAWYQLTPPVAAAGTPALNRNGKDVPRYPEWLGSITSTYRAPLNDRWQWYVRGDASYMGKRYVDFANLAWLDDYWLVNAAVGMQREDLRFELGVRNAFDEDAWLIGQSGNDFSQFGASFSRFGISLAPLEKRQFTLRMNYSF